MNDFILSPIRITHYHSRLTVIGPSYCRATAPNRLYHIRKMWQKINNARGRQEKRAGQGINDRRRRSREHVGESYISAWFDVWCSSFPSMWYIDKYISMRNCDVINIYEAQMRLTILYENRRFVTTKLQERNISSWYLSVIIWLKKITRVLETDVSIGLLRDDIRVLFTT